MRVGPRIFGKGSGDMGVTFSSKKLPYVGWGGKFGPEQALYGPPLHLSKAIPR